MRIFQYQKTRWVAWLILLLCINFIACSSDQKYKKLMHIEKGVTTQLEIIQIFGQPDSTVQGGKTLVLNYNKVKKHQAYMSHLSIVINTQTKRVINYRYFKTNTSFTLSR